MTDDPDLPDDLVAHARAAREPDARWRALAEGTASDAERAALAAEDPERFARWRPYDAAEDDALLDGLLARTAAGAPAEADLIGPVAAVIRPARWRRAAMIFTPVLLAAGLAIIILRPDASPTLPSYRIEDTSGDRATRADDAPRIVRPDARLRWILRPANPVQPTVAARAFAIDGARPTPLDLPFEAAPGGALRLDAPVGEALPGRTGPVSLLIVIGPERQIAELDPATLDPADPPVELRLLKHRLDIRAE